MSKIPKDNSFEKPVTKNIKNIYVHKINSLIKISRDSMAVDEVGALSQTKMAQKKIKKTYSQTDRNALKLEKNRQSARKARQRKNLYIKLLQNQVVFLRQQLSQSEAVFNSSQNYLKQVKSSQKQTGPKHQSYVEEELDRYISQDNLPDLNQSKHRNQKKAQRLRETVEEYKHWFVPELLKSISNLKKSQRANLNSKILKTAMQQFEEVAKYCKNKNQLGLKLLLPFEESSAEIKVTNILKTLNKNMEDLQTNLGKLGEVTQEVIQLIHNQEINELQLTEIESNRLRNIISEMNLCGLGDRPDKIIGRAQRWEEFPTADILTTMQKIIQFNQFIESTVVSNEQIQEEIQEQIGEESEMEQEKD